MKESELCGFEDETETIESNRVEEEVDENRNIVKERKANDNFTWDIC